MKKKLKKLFLILENSCAAAAYAEVGDFTTASMIAEEYKAELPEIQLRTVAQRTVRAD